MAKPIVKLVDVEVMEERILLLAEETVEELHRFGQSVLSEAQQRGAALDAKLIAILGWSSAVLAFLLFSSSGSKWVSAAAMIASAAAVLLSFLGLRSRMYCAPSEVDWFREELLDHPSRLKRHHVISMLTAHQSETSRSLSKMSFLARAEVALVSAAALVILQLLAGFLSVLGG
jgi:hypothetical protein